MVSTIQQQTSPSMLQPMKREGMDTSPFKVGNIARRGKTIDGDIGIIGNATQEEVSQQGMTAADKKIFMHFKSELT